MSRHDYYCHLDDEAESRQYHVRLTYEMEGHDPGDWTTPPCSGEIRLAELVVLQAREFDAEGNIAALKLQKAAMAHHELTLSQNGATPSRMLSKYLPDLFDAIFGQTHIKIYLQTKISEITNFYIQWPCLLFSYFP